MRRQGAEPVVGLDPSLWRGAVGTVEVPLGRWRYLLALSVATALLLLGVLADPSPVVQALAGAGLAGGPLGALRLASRSPQVIVSDTGIAVAGQLSGALNQSRSVRWDDVVEIRRPLFAPEPGGEHGGRRWTGRWFPQEFRVVRTSGRPLVVRGPLRGTSIEKLYAEVVARWQRGGSGSLRHGDPG